MHNNLIEQRTVGAAAARGAHATPATTTTVPATVPATALVLHGLAKSFGPRVVLERLDLELAAGQFVAIVGRSGCGKSTLLRAVAGLETLDGGTIGGADDVRMMFQEARLLPWKTVLQNVQLGLADDGGRALEALAAVGLASRAADWPAALSGGQRQRVALARALVHQPPLLLLDEPLGALDALTRIDMQRLIESLWLARGFTALLVTHDVQEAIALADRVLVIEQGAIALDVAVELPRPRQRDARFALLEQRLLNHLLGQPAGQAA
ncbi:ATP-binding cassette domain-containing protein [Massilia sp. DWR3-1-1]|uniref:ATP-binding cassette domain-containing protein n=1 Tax=Massilia sp. DWR3-1-1 TaxID=2804559 RepID=UPI003CF4E942